MPQTRECDYCGQAIEPGTGTMFVRTDGSTTYYCSSKCEKNADLGREPRETEWTAAGREQADRRASQATQEPAATGGREEQNADETAEAESEEVEPADDAEAVDETAEAEASEPADDAEEESEEVEGAESESEEAEGAEEESEEVEEETEE